MPEINNNNLAHRPRDLGKLTIRFKTPDAGEFEIRDYIEMNAELNDDEEIQNENVAKLKGKIKKVLGKFLQYGQCINIEFDLDNETAKVLPV